LKPAIGTPFSLGLVDDAAPVGDARVDLLVLNGALEEALAALAGQKAVVVSGHFVSAHRAQLVHPVLGVRLVGLSDARSSVSRISGPRTPVIVHHGGAPCKEAPG